MVHITFCMEFSDFQYKVYFLQRPFDQSNASVEGLAISHVAPFARRSSLVAKQQNHVSS